MKAKRCPFCNTIYSSVEKNCPNCNYKEPMSIDKSLWILIAILLPLAIIYQLNKIVDFSEIAKSFELPKTKKETKIKNTIVKNVPINPTSSLSGLSKAEIYSLRKSYVRNSVVFSNLENYSPNPDVYKIIDNLPWISAYEIATNGTENNPNIGKGDSRHSIMTNNPELLMGFITSEFAYGKEKGTFNKVDLLHPYKITWDEKNNTIRAHFDFTSFFKVYPSFKGISFYLDETNARDLGYSWIQSTQRRLVGFEKLHDNLSDSPYKMKGYYHRGFSCGLKGGCNNYSPYQEKMIIRINNTPSFIKFKLWKKEPIFTLQKADIIYEMYFD